MILQATIDKLEKGKVYCKPCLNNNIITELIWDENNERYISCKEHNRNVDSYIVKYNYELQKWSTYRGKNLNSKFQGIIETDKDIQDEYLKCKFVYFDINLLDKSIFIEKNENGNFYVSKFLDGIEYIHANSKDPFINYRVNLYSFCCYEECKQKFYFKELSYKLKESGEHFCCNQHSAKHRNKSVKMRKLFSERMIEWHKTEEGKEFTRKHYTELGNSKIAQENLRKGREIAQKTWVGSETHLKHISELGKKIGKDPNARKKMVKTRKDNIAIKEGFRNFEEKEKYLKELEEKEINKAKKYGYNSIEDYKKDKRRARKMNMSIEEYIQYKRGKEIEKQEEDKQIQELLNKYGLKDYLSYRNKLNSIKRLGFDTIEAYEEHKNLLKEKDKKKKEELLSLAKSYGYDNYKSYSIEFGHAVRNGFDNIDDYREYKSKNKIFKNKNYNIILNEQEFIIFNKFIKEIVKIDKRLRNNKKIQGIYCILIDYYPFYIGDSINIMERFLYHSKNIIKYDKYFDNIINDILNNNNLKNRSISLIILDNFNISKNSVENRKLIKDIELNFIQKFHPYSQLCKNNDWVDKDLKSRGSYSDFKENYDENLRKELKIIIKNYL